MLNRVLQIIHQRIASGEPDSSYVASLVQKGEDKILKKIVEEATEVVLAAKGQDRVALVHELTDLWFHCLLLMVPINHFYTLLIKSSFFDPVFE